MNFIFSLFVVVSYSIMEKSDIAQCYLQQDEIKFTKQLYIIAAMQSSSAG